MKKELCAALLVCFAGTNLAMAGSNYSYQQTVTPPVYQQSYYPAPMTATPQNSTLKGRVVTVPAGAMLPATVTAPISSANSTVGQLVNINLSSDFYYNNTLIAPAGSYITGTVVEASKAKHGSMNGKLCIRFTQITTPYGLQIPISALIKTDDGTGVLVGGTKMDVTKEYAKDMAVGAGAGALSGVVFGALAGGSIGRGAALGTAVGAGGGLVKSAWDKGNDVEIPANSQIELMLTQPITVSPSAYDYE